MPPRSDSTALDAFVGLVGADLWHARFADLEQLATKGPRSRKAILGRHAIGYAIERLRRGVAKPKSAELRIGQLARDAVALYATLSPVARKRLVNRLQAALTGGNSLIDVFHLLRTAELQRERGFTIRFTGLEQETPYDLVIERNGVVAEIACVVVSAEEGRHLHRGAWFDLADRIDPDLQIWLSGHPGRYLLRVNLPEGLRENDAGLPRLHAQVRELLGSQRRTAQDAAAVLRLDRLLLAGAQADELGLLSLIRREFSPEAHLSMTTAGGGVFVMAAQAGRENEIAQAICRRLSAWTQSRLIGARQGILAVFIEDIERSEWRGLRERLDLEGEARQFLTRPEARPIIAVTFASRLELFGSDDAAPDGDLRFRNPRHVGAKSPALTPAITSSV